MWNVILCARRKLNVAAGAEAVPMKVMRFHQQSISISRHVFIFIFLVFFTGQSLGHNGAASGIVSQIEIRHVRTRVLLYFRQVAIYLKFPQNHALHRGVKDVVIF